MNLPKLTLTRSPSKRMLGLSGELVVVAVGYDVVCNRPKLAAYRAPSAPIAAFAVESVIDELAGAIDMDPLELRLKNAAKDEHA